MHFTDAKTVFPFAPSLSSAEIGACHKHVSTPFLVTGAKDRRRLLPAAQSV